MKVINVFYTVRLKGSAKVMQRDSRKRRHGPIRNAARQATREPGIFSFVAPTADDVEAFVKFFNERRNLGRIMLQIAVHGNDDFAAGSVKAGFKCRRLAKIPP